MKRWTRFLVYSGAVLLVLTAAALVSALLVFRSAWFHDAVRNRVVAEVERASGGRAEIGSFHFDWRTLTGTVNAFVLHGKEQAGEPPLFHADSVRVGLKIISALRRDVDISSLIVERPTVDLIVYPDGTTNVPSPKVQASEKNPVQRLLDLAVGHFEARGGLFEFKDEKTPFDVKADNLRAIFDFDRSGPMYKGHVASRQLHLNTSVAGPLAMDEKRGEQTR